MFVKNQYGKGHIYFLTFALEWLLSDRPGIFKDETCKPYYKFYEAFAHETEQKIVKSLHPCVLTTEHCLDDHRRLVVAINYADKDIQADFAVKDGWQITKELHGTKAIPAHEAYIFEIEK